MTKTLVITNDFPPRPGGIQTFVHGLLKGLNPTDVVVLTSKYENYKKFDADQEYLVVRHDTELLLPTKAVGDHALALIDKYQCDSVLFGASAPLGLLSARLKKHGIKKTVALTHGHEVGWAFTPGLKQSFKKIVKEVDKLTYLTDFTFKKFSEILNTSELAKFERLTPGLDTELFNPNNVINGKGEAIRNRFKIGNKPTVVCISRLMPRKGQDTLIKIWPQVLAQVPNAHLLIVGGGSYKSTLQKMVFDQNINNSVTLTGSVAWQDLPGFYASGQVFVMPVRTRNFGFDVEGLGIVYLEASATGLPVIAGISGGAPEAVVDGETGFVIDAKNTIDLVNKIAELLLSPELRRNIGKQGRTWIENEWQWPARHDQLRKLLATNMS